ncbi:MAG: protein kinase [Aestuariibacter sp.]
MDITALLKTYAGKALIDNALIGAFEANFEGKQISGYTLDKNIYNGSMAQIYHAHRSDGVFERPAAIKIIHSKLLTPSFQMRFILERQILSTLSHPNIAHLYDGGFTEEGTAYFIMEYIEGKHLDDFLKASKPSFLQRIALFRQLLQAVIYAHENRIIHRDIKPSNILVDDNGVPKLLDFGIAELAEADNNAIDEEETPLTYRFASPEQIMGQQVSYRSDIFQLGFILHILLTEQHLLQHKNLEEIMAWSQTQQHIEPASQRVRQLPISERYAGYKHVNAELDAIIAKCLRHDRQERYDSVQALLDDVLAFCNREPVTAYSQAKRFHYRLRKLVQRQPAISALVMGFSMIAIAGSSFYIDSINSEKVKAIEAAIRAEKEADKSDQIVDFLVNIFNVSHTDEGQGRGETITARELLDNGYNNLISDESTHPPEASAEMLLVIGNAYLSLGLYFQAEKALQKSISLQRQLSENAQQSLSHTLNRLSWTQRQLGQIEQATDSLNASLEVARKQSQPYNVAESFSNAALTIWRHGDFVQAAEYFDQALNLVAGESSEDFLALRASLLRNYATMQVERGFIEGVGDLIVEIENILPKLSDNSPTPTYLKLLKSRLAWSQGNLSYAEELVDEIIVSATKKYGPDHPRVTDFQFNQATFWQLQGRFDGVEEAYQRLLQLDISATGEHHEFVYLDYMMLAELYLNMGKIKLVEPPLLKAKEGFASLFPFEHRRNTAVNIRYARYLNEQGRFREAEMLLRRVIPLMEKDYAESHLRLNEARMEQARSLFHQNKHPEIRSKLLQAAKRAFAGRNDLLEQRLQTLSALLPPPTHTNDNLQKSGGS